VMKDLVHLQRNGRAVAKISLATSKPFKF
jgi:hypothetical protein